MSYTWINGDYFESTTASLKVTDLAVQRGYGVFDFFRCKKKWPFLLPQYLERFYNSANGLNLKVPLDKSELTEVIHQFIEHNQLWEHGVKLILTGGYAEDGYTPLEPNFIIQAYQIKLPPPSKYQEGFRIMTFEYRRELPTVKSINYLRGIQLIPELQQRKLDDVLYGKDSVISEFPRSNIFIVDFNDRLITPANHILEGITRKTVMDLAGDYYEVEVRDVFMEELMAAKEAFLTSTTKGIMPICEVDGHQVGAGTSGPVTRHLAEMLDELPPDFEL